MKSLKIGESLRLSSGETAKVLGLKRNPGEFWVYNFEVRQYHNYYVTAHRSDPGVLVHNQGCDGDTDNNENSGRVEVDNSASTPEEQTLWRAPARKNKKPDSEVVNGYDPKDYPGNGVYMGTRREVAEKFQRQYRNGMQEVRLPKSDYDRMLKEGKIVPDGYLPKGDAVRIEPANIPEFNEAIRRGTPNNYYPQGGAK